MRSSDQVKNGAVPKNPISSSHDTQILHVDHDKIVVWLYQKLKNDHSFVKKCFILNDLDEIISTSRQIECPIMGNGKRGVIGFADLVCRIEYKKWLSPEELSDNEKAKEWAIKKKEHENCRPEWPYKTSEPDYEQRRKNCEDWQKIKESFGDYYKGTTHEIFRERTLHFEVKTAVNIGETIRQLNYYDANGIDYGRKWAVCAPAFTQSIILNEQGIYFIPYEP